MSDFFEGLAARSSGAATALRPRVASAYETREAAEVVEEVPATASPVATRAMPVAPEEPATADPAERIVFRDVLFTQAETVQAPPAIILPQRPERRPEQHPEHPEQGRDQRPGQHFEQRLEHRVERVHNQTNNQTHEQTHHEEMIENVRELPPAPQLPERRADTHTTSSPVPAPAEALPPRRPQDPTLLHEPANGRHQPLTIRPTPAANRQPLLDRQSQPDPVVRITIGRVEVRAVQPAQPAPRPAPPPVAQGPTLAEFLEQRERRK